MKKFALHSFLIFLLVTTALSQTRDYARWVNPFIGTGGHGHTFPGATMPFGMVQLSPDTRTDNWDGSSGYHYSDDVIYGFSHTHLSGTGIPDYCDILFMPIVGKPAFFAKEGDKGKAFFPVDEEGHSLSGSHFSHANEKAEPGYYSVKLDKDDVFAEMTATPRVGVHRYTFPKTKSAASILIDLGWRDQVLDSSLTVYAPTKQDTGGSEKSVSINRIEGYRRSRSWAKDQVVYFVAEFSKPYSPEVLSDGLESHLASSGVRGWDAKTYSGKPIRAALYFNTSDGQPITVKVAISNVSIEGARKNLEAEMPGWDFDKVRADARAAWNKELSKIEVSGGTDAQTTNFYTALYHTMIQPNIFNDVDGNYRGLDGKTHNTGDGRQETGDERQKPKTQDQRPSEQYTVFSLWDTFRAAHPLYTIIDQKRTVDFINTFIRQYEQGGRLPVWELAGNETDCMIGYHAVSVIADAMAKGIKGFDYEKAYAAAKHSAELDHFGLAAYKKRGYISMEDENESVSKTLEYAYDDWCIAQMANILRKKEFEKLPKPKPSEWVRFRGGRDLKFWSDSVDFLKRSRNFENLFDTKIGFFRPKKNGGFVEPFAPNEVTFGFTEGNSWQYSFFVPQDVSRLMELQGGREKFVAKLDELFTTDQKLAGREQADLTGLIGQYAHGNEPSHHIAYLYSYAGQPWKTQKYVRRILDEFYKPQPDGLIGNEDCGQMSAWYILSASGFYEVTPGTGIYVFGTPLFPEMTYRLENGKTFTIKAKNVSEKNMYIAGATFNGASYKKAFLTHEDLMKGGVLEFTMIDKPVTTAFTEFPVSGRNESFVAVPTIEGGSRVFQDRTTIKLSTLTPDAQIFYTTNGSEPTAKSDFYLSIGTIEITDTETIKAIAINSGGHKSQIAEATFIKKPNDWTVKVTSGYSTQYTGGGENAIVDGIRGTKNFASGEWQGVQGKTYEAVIDLQKKTLIREVGGSFLQVASAWIWLPTRITFEGSEDGVNFTKIADIETHADARDMEPRKQEYRIGVNSAYARYVRVRAYNFGKIPDWHPGVGGEPWIFVDEILVETVLFR